MRKVINGERLSGHGTVSGGYPEICILDGVGLNGGSMICSIQSFHCAEVAVNGQATELSFEDTTCLSIQHGIVMYADGRE
jgi:hypothetical protein